MFQPVRLSAALMDMWSLLIGTDLMGSVVLSRRVASEAALVRLLWILRNMQRMTPGRCIRAWSRIGRLP